MSVQKSDSVTPRHIGIILDGNRRWAKEHKLPQLEGHRVGAENINTIAEHAFNKGIEYVTAFIFSTENWNRSKDEISYLMGLLPIIFKKNINKLIKNGIRVHWLGSYERLSSREIDLIESAVEKTKHLTKGNLCFCFNYGGQQEIVDACKRMLSETVDATKLTVSTMREYLYTPQVPDVDVIIRTSGEQRISNFMLWRAAYSELIFVDTHWPAFKTEDLDRALEEYSYRQRRFGC